MNASDHPDLANATIAPRVAVRLGSVHRQILRALIVLASATLLVRVVGMGMQVIVTSRFGEGPQMDAYFIAAGGPMLLAVVGTATIEQSVVPVYARVCAQGNREQAARLFSTLLHLVLMAATGLTVLMLVFRRPVILMSAPAADPFRMERAVSLALVVFPSLVLTTALALMESVLNAEGQFGWPAYAGLLVPLASAAAVLVAGKSLGVVTLGLGALIGLCLQGVAFVVRLRRAKIRYRPILDMHNPALGPVVRGAWPALLGSCIVAISPLVDQMFASALSAGNISAINYALKLSSVPTGVIFVAVQRAVLPHLSRQAGLRDMPAFKATLRLYMWLVGLGTLLVTALLVTLAHPLVQILFQRGAFSAADTDRTATTLIGFVAGLLPMGLDFLLASAFSALGQNRVNMYAAVFSVTTNAIFDYLLSRVWGSLGIALATSAFYACGLPLVLFMLRRMIGRLELLMPPRELLQVVRIAPRIMRPRHAAQERTARRTRWSRPR